MLPELVLVGGGGHASVIREAAAASGWRVAGYYDDADRHTASMPKNPYDAPTQPIDDFRRLGRFEIFYAILLK